MHVGAPSSADVDLYDPVKKLIKSLTMFAAFLGSSQGQNRGEFTGTIKSHIKNMMQDENVWQLATLAIPSLHLASTNEDGMVLCLEDFVKNFFEVKRKSREMSFDELFAPYDLVCEPKNQLQMLIITMMRFFAYINYSSAKTARQMFIPLVKSLLLQIKHDGMWDDAMRALPGLEKNYNGVVDDEVVEKFLFEYVWELRFYFH